jgi:hypothetical protein
MKTKLRTDPGDPKRISLNELAKEILGEELNTLIDDVEVTETSLDESDQQPKAAIVMIGDKIFYLFRGSVARKKVMALIAGSGGLVWFINHYLVPLFTK